MNENEFGNEFTAGTYEHKKKTIETVYMLEGLGYEFVSIHDDWVNLRFEMNKGNLIYTAKVHAQGIDLETKQILKTVLNVMDDMLIPLQIDLGHGEEIPHEYFVDLLPGGRRSGNKDGPHMLKMVIKEVKNEHYTMNFFVTNVYYIREVDSDDRE